MRLGNVRVAGEAVGHGASLVDAGADLLDLELELADALGVVVDGVELLALGVRGEGAVLLGGLARRAGGGELSRVLEVLGEHLFELADGLAMLLDEVGQVLDVAGDDGAGKRRVGDDLVDEAGDALVGTTLLREVVQLSCHVSHVFLAVAGEGKGGNRNDVP